MTKDTLQETYVGKHVRRTQEIHGPLAVFFGKVKSIVLQSGLDSFRNWLRVQLLDCYAVAYRRLNYSRGSQGATSVFDLVNAGPRHRFATANGLVANCTLGLGYQAGAPKFRSFAKAQFGLDMTDEESVRAVSEYREKNWRVVKYWYAHQDALLYSARRSDESHQIELMSGRILTYWYPRLNGREVSVYQTLGAPRAHLYGGKITENEMQATCRDILCDAWRKCHRELPPSVKMVLSVHDELVFDCPDELVEEVKPLVRECMVNCSPWAVGLPLGVDIVVSKVYTK